MSDSNSISSTDKFLSVLCHLSGFVGGFFLIPLIVYLAKKDASTYVTENAKEALNFHISLAIYGVISGILVLLLIGIVLLVLLVLAYLVLSIIASVASAGGYVFRYPLTIRLLK